MLYDEALQMLDDYVLKAHGGNVSSAARALGVNMHAFTRWIKRERTPNSEDLLRILESFGVEFKTPSASEAREICFVNPKIVNAEEGSPPIIPEDYIAVPLVSEAGAGPGIVPLVDHEGWFLVYRREPSIRSRSNMIAVRIASGSTSMEPTLHPGDIVLVDRDDKVVTRPGCIFLVMEPDGSGKIKRVRIENLTARRLTRLTYYSDNVQENPPEVYTLEDDFEGDIDRAIVGRVVWAWSDLSRK